MGRAESSRRVLRNDRIGSYGCTCCVVDGRVKRSALKMRVMLLLSLRARCMR